MSPDEHHLGGWNRPAAHSSRCLHPPGQGCTRDPRFRRTPSQHPERLEPYWIPCASRRESCDPHCRCYPRTGPATHPERDGAPRGFVDHLSDSSHLADPDAARRQRAPTQDASSQLVHPTLSKTSTRAPHGHRPTRRRTSEIPAGIQNRTTARAHRASAGTSRDPPLPTEPLPPRGGMGAARLRSVSPGPAP